jgi:hypothetical protein
VKKGLPRPEVKSQAGAREIIMHSRTRKALVAGAVTVALLPLGAGPLPAQTTTITAAARGPQSFHGFIVSAGLSGHRNVVLTRVVARGAFDGVGEIQEVRNRPGDADNVTRDNLVFRDGKMHIVTVNHKFVVHLNPKTCKFRASVTQTGRVAGGTGMFKDASGRYTSSVHGYGIAARKADGSCKQRGALLHEIDFVKASGRLRF